MEKKEFYENRSQGYTGYDKQGWIRYQKSINLAGLKSGCSVLDVGCKHAHLLDILCSEGIECDYTGVDISEAVIESLVDKKGRFQVCDIMKPLPFGDGEFDFLFCLEVLEHVENPTLVLKEFYRVLKPGGVLMLSVPNVYNWLVFLGNILKMDANEGHIHSFTYRDMKTLLDFSGLKIEKRIGTYATLPYSLHGIKNGRYIMFKSNSLVLSSSHIYKISKKAEGSY